MSMHYLESHKFFVESHNEMFPMVYIVTSYETFANSKYIHIHMELVAGQENSNDCEWLPAERFAEDIQTEFASWYFMEESMKEALEANDFEVMDMEEIPSEIQAFAEAQGQVYKV